MAFSGAAAALQYVTHSPELSSRLVAIEAGAAAGAASAAPLMPGSVSHSALPAAYAASASDRSTIKHNSSAPTLLYAAPHAGSGQLDAGALLLNNAAAAAPVVPAQHLTPVDPMSHLLSAEGLAGMTRSFSEVSLGAGLDSSGLGGRLAANSMSTGDLLALSQGLQRPAGPYGLRGIASTGSIWPQHMGPSLGSSPITGGVWPGQLHSSAGNLQDVLQQQQAALNAAILQGAAAGALLQPNPLVQNAAVQAALQQALITQQAAALLQSNMVPGGLLNSQRRSEPPLGGRLARRPLDPVAEAERRAQQEKLYSLDLSKIRAGESEQGHAGLLGAECRGQSQQPTSARVPMFSFWLWLACLPLPLVDA